MAHIFDGNVALIPQASVQAPDELSDPDAFKRFIASEVIDDLLYGNEELFNVIYTEFTEEDYFYESTDLTEEALAFLAVENQLEDAIVHNRFVMNLVEQYFRERKFDRAFTEPEDYVFDAKTFEEYLTQYKAVSEEEDFLKIEVPKILEKRQAELTDLQEEGSKLEAEFESLVMTAGRSAKHRNSGLPVADSFWRKLLRQEKLYFDQVYTLDAELKLMTKEYKQLQKVSLRRCTYCC